MLPGDEPLPFRDARALAARIRARARRAMSAALASGELAGLDRPAAPGAGDVSYGIDVGAELELAAWHGALALRGPLSLLSEERGWRHLGPGASPGPAAEPRELAGFDHGGPRLVVDPIDGTRNFMADLRPAWTALAACGPGPGAPRLDDVAAGLLSELPPSNARTFRELTARRGEGCLLVQHALEPASEDDPPAARALALDTGDDDRVDQGYFCFFRFTPSARPAIAAIEADFFARLEAREGAELAHCYDDQYICNAGQLALLATGTYRLIADLRAWAAGHLGLPGVTSKPYDVAAAVLVAREAGCVVEAPEGGPLDFPLDATTPVSFVGYANRATAARLRPHLAAALHAARRRA